MTRIGTVCFAIARSCKAASDFLGFSAIRPGAQLDASTPLGRASEQDCSSRERLRKIGDQPRGQHENLKVEMKTDRQRALASSRAQAWVFPETGATLTLAQERFLYLLVLDRRKAPAPFSLFRAPTFSLRGDRVETERLTLG